MIYVANITDESQEYFYVEKVVEKKSEQFEP